MANDFGVSFNPANALAQQQRGGSQDPNASVQQAVRTLSLRLPSVVGARSIAPMDLLSGQGGAGLSGLAQNQPFGLQQILQMLMGNGPTTLQPGQSGQMDPVTGKPKTGGQTDPLFKFITDGEPTPGSFDPITTETPNTYGKPSPQPIPNPGPLPPIGWGNEPTYGKASAPTNKFDPGSRYSE